MNLDIEYDRHQKLSTVDQQLTFVDDKVTDWHHTDQKRFILLKERLSSYVEYIEQYRKEKEYEEKAFESDLTSLEQKMMQRFAEERQAEVAMEKKITGLVNERFQDLRHQLASESKTRYDLLENLKTCLENDFPKLRNEIQLEIMQREQGD